MGNFFKSIPSGPTDEKLIIYLKSRKLEHINDAIEQLNMSYPTNSTLNMEEFMDAFGGILEDKAEQIFLLLENNHNAEGQVDVYESLAVLIVFSGEEFPVKLEFVFNMFDFDKSGEIEKKELIMTLQTCIRALCKLVKITPPEVRILEYFSEKMFLDLDSDRSQSISFREFSIWLTNSWELQDFMLQYAMIQTFENAERRTKEQKIFFEKLFESASGNKDLCEVDSIGELFQKELNKQNPDVIKLLLQTLVDSSQEFPDIPQGLIYKKAYIDIMSAWSAFDATDINHDNMASMTELRYLLYAFEGDKPDVFRIKDEMAILDTDGSGYISREEWINYLCVKEKGKFVFRGHLKILFNKYDKDNSGFLTIPEIKNLLTDSMREMYLKYKYKGEQDQKDFEGMINTLAEQILDTLNSDEDKQKDDKTISWIEFKSYMDQAYGKQEQLRQFLKNF
ncbi:hypothetical protein pb186bvf_015040 [Paramecium bursaria]